MSAMNCAIDTTHAAIFAVNDAGYLSLMGLMPLKRKKNGKAAIKAAMQAYTRTQGAGDSERFVAVTTAAIETAQMYAYFRNRILAHVQATFHKNLLDYLA